MLLILLWVEHKDTVIIKYVHVIQWERFIQKKNQEDKLNKHGLGRRNSPLLCLCFSMRLHALSCELTNRQSNHLFLRVWCYLHSIYNRSYWVECCFGCDRGRNVPSPSLCRWHNLKVQQKYYEMQCVDCKCPLFQTLLIIFVLNIFYMYVNWSLVY